MFKLDAKYRFVVQLMVVNHMEKDVSLFMMQKPKEISADVKVHKAAEEFDKLLKVKGLVGLVEQRACHDRFQENMKKTSLSSWFELYARVIFCHLYTEDANVRRDFLDTARNFQVNKLYRHALQGLAVEREIKSEIISFEQEKSLISPSFMGKSGINERKKFIS